MPLPTPLVSDYSDAGSNDVALQILNMQYAELGALKAILDALDPKAQWLTAPVDLFPALSDPLTLGPLPSGRNE